MMFRQIADIEGVTVGDVNINNLRYADGTAPLADSEESLQAPVNEVNEAEVNKVGEDFNRKMNAKKTTQR